MTTPVALASLSKVDPATPAVAKSDEAFLTGSRASGTLTYTTLAASGAYTLYGVVACADLRKLAVHLDYDSASATGRPAIRILYAATATQPADTDAAWRAFVINDGSVTATTLGGTVPAGAGTALPQWGAFAAERMLWLPRVTQGTSDVIAEGIVIGVEGARWVKVEAAEHGDTANPGGIALAVTGIV